MKYSIIHNLHITIVYKIKLIFVLQLVNEADKRKDKRWMLECVSKCTDTHTQSKQKKTRDERDERNVREKKKSEEKINNLLND